MNIRSNLVSLSILTFLVSCGEDVGSKRPVQPKPERVTPGVEAESGNFRSFIHRDRGNNILSYQDEIAKTHANNLPSFFYRSIPLMEKDDEGSLKNVVTVSDVGRPSTECGTGQFANITERINDCRSKNENESMWEGSRYGASGEGNWRLVYRNASGKELWIDSSTGMVWSDVITVEGVNSFNWCKASGNFQGVSPENSINCQDEGAGENICGNYSVVGAQIKWRLPTRNDFLQADLNGMRFVLPKENDLGLWTATMRAGAVGRKEAWIYSSKEGTLVAGNLTSLRQVRCIGAPKL